jgi:dTDP-4-dehydrorhamnose 3,5-epimerase
VLIEELAVPDAYLLTPRIFRDDRGSFLECYRQEVLAEALGYPFTLAQANVSTSRRGVIRGIHYADVPPGQAKYVTCLRGAVLDVVVDLRVGSPTFAAVAAVQLDDREGRAVYVAEGLGHGFCALTEDATVTYLCSSVFSPTTERGIHPNDPALRLPWPGDVTPALSSKDEAAVTLDEALASGVLPTFQACRHRYAQLRAAGGARVFS